MNLIVNGTAILHGKATLPGSKSHSIRAILLASLCNGTSVLHNILASDDTRDAITVCKALGAHIIESNNTVTITGIGLPLKVLNNTIHTGNSGITTHFLMPLLGLRANSHQPITLDCSAQMRTRPITALINALRNLGMKFDSHTLPTKISGQLLGGKTEVDGTTSQYLSALLLALPLAEKDSEITVKNLQERPYVEMTLAYLTQQGISYFHESSENTDTYKIAGRQTYKPLHITIPADFSSASYLITAAALIPGEVILLGLDMLDSQGDKQLISILQIMGAKITIGPTELRIIGGERLDGIIIDGRDIPDLLPVLAVIGTHARGKTEIINIKHARIKETDRIHSMSEGLSKLGAKIETHEDKLIIYQSNLRGNHVMGFGDHRTVMALSLAGMIADGTTHITDRQAIHKTYPNYIKTMQSLGAKMEVTHETA